MTLPYSEAQSGSRALDEIRKILTNFGASRFGTMTDNEKQEILVQFTYRGRDISVRASVAGYAAAYMKEHPYTSRTRGTQAQHQRRALDQAQISTCSILRDWIKGQITAIEVGLLSFEGAFLGQILLGNGKTVLDTVESQKLLPPATEEGKPHLTLQRSK
jgi:hypothetical protein